MSGAGDNPRGEESSVSFDASHVFRLLLATDEGLQPIVRAAIEIQRDAKLDWPQLVLIGTDDAFPFRPRPSTILVPGMPADVIACEPELDRSGIASRLASLAGLPGCYDGKVTELAELWLNSLQPNVRAQTALLVSAADRTVSEVEELGRRMHIPVQVIPTQGALP